MFPVIAEYAVEASEKTQVIFTTHSPQFLDAFNETQPTTTVTMWEDNHTILKTIDGEELKDWLKDYSLDHSSNQEIWRAWYEQNGIIV